MGPPRDSKDAFTEVKLRPAGDSVINYSYTAQAWRLVGWDLASFVRNAKYIPYIVYPISKPLSGPMSELAPTRQNIYCVLVHSVLVVVQLAFLLGIGPALFLLPGWVSVPGIAAFLLTNKLACDVLLNGSKQKYHSNRHLVPMLPEHKHEKWIFLNGVSIGEHWMKSSLDRLALTFRRPIIGIHNKTSGIIFDLIECIIQRTLGYATSDIRYCYEKLKQTLYNPQYTKVVFIVHSQGGIEGGMVIDWLLQELPQDQLSKLEVYTFGNAANHFNNPHRFKAQEDKASGNKSPEGRATLAAEISPPTPPSEPATTNGTSEEHASNSGKQHISDLLVQEAHSSDPTDVSGLAIGHIEHYAHTTDFVARWGVMHFFDSNLGYMTPRFMGRLFQRTTPRGGHLLCMHYLDEMFPLKPDRSAAGGFSGCLEAGKGEGKNNFMASKVDVSVEDLESSCVTHRTFDEHLLDVHPDDGHNHHGRPGLTRTTTKHIKQVAELSRLWQYRNGFSPENPAPKAQKAHKSHH